MFCNKCGAVVEDGVKFCPKCGNRIKVLTEEEKKAIEVQRIKMEEERRRQEELARIEREEQNRRIAEQLKKDEERRRLEEARKEAQKQREAEKRKEKIDKIKESTKDTYNIVVKKISEIIKNIIEIFKNIVEIIKKHKRVFMIAAGGVLAIIIIVSIVTVVNARKAQFKIKDGIERYYENNKLVTNKLVEVNGNTYYIGNNGCKVTSEWIELDEFGNIGYFDYEGIQVKNRICKLNGSYYYFGIDGNVKKDELFDYKNSKAYADKDGKLSCNTIKIIDGKDYYFDNKCVLSKMNGWVSISENDASDGIIGDFYLINGERARNNTADGYYFDNDGRILINQWANGCFYGMDGKKVVNQWVGDYYLDANGEITKNQWVDDYYVDKDGLYLKNSWVEKNYVGPDGKKVYNCWVEDYYIGSNGEYVTNTVINGITIGTDGKAIKAATTETSASSANNKTTNNNITNNNTTTNTNTIDGTSAKSNVDLYISNTSQKFTDEYDDGDHICKMSIICPVVSGNDSSEAQEINDLISEEIGNIMSDLEGIARDYDEAPKTITINKAEVTAVSKTRFRITLTGKVTPRSGSSKSLKFRLNYDRNDHIMEYENLS